MLLEGAHPFSLVYAGKRQSDHVPARLAKEAEQLAADGRLLEVERADFGEIGRAHV